MTDEFSRYHPVVNLIFYLLVLGTTMFQMSVGLVFISLFSSVVYYFMLKKTEGLKYCAVVVGIIIVSAIINPLFSHNVVVLSVYGKSCNFGIYYLRINICNYNRGNVVVVFNF